MSEFEIVIIGVILIVIVVSVTFLLFIVFRRKRKIKEQKLKEQPPETTILHRCSNPTCRKIFEKPIYMIEYAPPPKKTYLACPYCRVILEETQREKESEPEKIPTLSAEKLEEKGKEEGLKSFTLILVSNLLSLKKVMGILASYEIVPSIQEKDKMFILSFSSKTNYDFSNLKNLGWIKEVKVE